MIPWKRFLSKHRLVNLLPAQGWVAGKLALSWESESGWVAGSTSQVILRQRKVKGQSSLLSTVLCWVKLFATLSKVSKELIFYQGHQAGVPADTQLPSGKIMAGLHGLGFGLA